MFISDNYNKAKRTKPYQIYTTNNVDNFLRFHFIKNKNPGDASLAFFPPRSQSALLSMSLFFSEVAMNKKAISGFTISCPSAGNMDERMSESLEVGGTGAVMELPSVTRQQPSRVLKIRDSPIGL